MKKLLLLIAVISVNGAFAQKNTSADIPVSDGKVFYQRIQPTLNNQSRNLLYNNAQLWFIDRYKSLKNIEMQDYDLGRIVGREAEIMTFNGLLNLETTYNIQFIVQIDCKDNKYRCRIFNITLESQDEGKNKIIISPEELLAVINKKSNNVIFNEKQARRALESMDTAIKNTMDSLYPMMNENNEF